MLSGVTTNCKFTERFKAISRIALSHTIQQSPVYIAKYHDK